MSASRWQDRAPQGALFAFVLALLLPSWTSAAAPLCPPDRIDERVTVRHVHDGDTVVLTDGRKVRIVGINTPELARDGRPAEPLAGAAREALVSLLTNNPRLGLRFGAERQDQYGRTLAHLYLPNGASVAAKLLSQGLGAAVAVAPTAWAVECHLQAEHGARDRGAGIWRASVFGPVDSRTVGPVHAGFRLVRGRITRIGESRDALWLNFEGRFALRLPRAALVHFNQPRRLEGRTVEVRGWIYETPREMRMTIRNPAAIKVLK